jgi:ketosteroid isomerase-like protein
MESVSLYLRKRPEAVSKSLLQNFSAMSIIKGVSSLFLFSGLILSCNSGNPSHTETDTEKIKTEVSGAEKDFEKMAAEKGIAEAFEFYADSNAVIKRQNDSLIRGKANIRNYYSADYFKSASVKWSPDSIDVAGDGSLAWTYGKYNWESKDSTGKLTVYKGVFHTVWKHQKDGSWKYVWD